MLPQIHLALPKIIGLAGMKNSHEPGLFCHPENTLLREEPDGLQVGDGGVGQEHMGNILWERVPEIITTHGRKRQGGYYHGQDKFLHGFSFGLKYTEMFGLL